MKTVQRTRKDNLKYIIDTRFSGVVNRTARAIGVQQSQIARVYAKGEYRRNVGDNLARRIETALNLPEGWLDTEHAGSDKLSNKMDFLDRAQRSAVEAIIDQLIAASERGGSVEFDHTERTHGSNRQNLLFTS